MLVEAEMIDCGIVYPRQNLESAAQGLPLGAMAKLTQAKLLCQLLSYCLFFPPICNDLSNMEICLVTFFGRADMRELEDFTRA